MKDSTTDSPTAHGPAPATMSNHSDTQAERLAQAIAIAATAFRFKLDKGGQPYILHCLRVMNGVNQQDPQLMQMAVLHDLIEDCPDWSINQLREKGFSHKVCGVLELLTHEKSVPYADYIEKLSANPYAVEVKLADLRDNSNITRLKGLEAEDFERLEKYHRAYVTLMS
jgi:guanosine-3',5'-bis(diphosphate) 3'-pyrophosphohydrolase